MRILFLEILLEIFVNAVYHNSIKRYYPESNRDWRKADNISVVGEPTGSGLRIFGIQSRPPGYAHYKDIAVLNVCSGNRLFAYYDEF